VGSLEGRQHSTAADVVSPLAHLVKKTVLIEVMERHPAPLWEGQRWQRKEAMMGVGSIGR
jgi:hypothetical protein